MYIHQFSVNNYRSLRNVSVGDLSKAVILYGDNDSGKSNILSFLDMVFQPKFVEEVTITKEGEYKTTRPSGFWKGQIDNFSNNFYQNNQDPISFSVLIKIERKEILELKNLPEKFSGLLPKNHDEDVLQIEGVITSLGADRAEMSLVKSEINQKIIYSIKDDTPEFLPDKSFEGLSLSERQMVFDGLMNKLEGAFTRVPPDRFLGREEEQERDVKVNLSSETLKNWLFQASHDRVDEKVIRDITRQFNSDPFNHGNISLVRVGKNELEIFVEGKNGLKLPIGRRGSGVQQILMILAYVTKANAPFVGIEEIEINLSPATQKVLVTSLMELINSRTSVVRQIFFTTHSPHVGKRNEAERRGVWMENGETKVKKPSEADVTDFFRG